MITLGINAAFHDPAACLVDDGRIVAAVEEERFTHVKHGKRPVPFSAWELPFHAIDYCLREAGLLLRDVDHVAYSFDPRLLLPGQADSASLSLPVKPSALETKKPWESPWEPLFLCYIMNAPLQLIDGPPLHLKKRFQGAVPGRPRWHFVQHHISHAASAYHASPFPRAAVMTLDGRGEKATTAFHVGEGAMMRPVGEVTMPHSLGLLYERVTSYLGFLHSSDEYKVMALASFGEPTYAEQFRKIVRLGDDGSYVIEPHDLEDLFGPMRQKGAELKRRDYDIARSLQVVLEETVLELSRWLRRETGEKRLCMAGGVALNCVMNARLRDSELFEDIWVQPAAGDAGTALGAALWVDAVERGARERGPGMDHAYLGPRFDDEEIEDFLRWSKLPYLKLADVARQTADLLAQDKIVGWFQGRMEFGPRALGARSILASPIDSGMQARLNEIKEREDFRPVAPAVLEEEAPRWFKGAGRSPFMLFVYDVLPDKADRIPAVRHIDGTARIQTVNRRQNPLYYDLLSAFHRRTGVPVLVNTSFNTRSEPIVCTPRDAVECFWTSPLDALAIGSFLLTKKASQGR